MEYHWPIVTSYNSPSIKRVYLSGAVLIQLVIHQLLSKPMAQLGKGRRVHLSAVNVTLRMTKWRTRENGVHFILTIRPWVLTGKGKEMLLSKEARDLREGLKGFSPTSMKPNSRKVISFPKAPLLQSVETMSLNLEFLLKLFILSTIFPQH